MTVNELVELLKNFPGDMDVVLKDQYNYVFDVRPTVVVERVMDGVLSEEGQKTVVMSLVM